MKKILLASTVLVGTTGFAAADVTFSGAAYTGLAYANMNFGAGANATTLIPEINALFTAGMMTTTDGGLEAGANFTVLSGGWGMEKDPTDAQFGLQNWFSPFGGILGASAYLSGDWGKVVVAFDTDSDDDSSNGSQSDATVTYSNTWGNFDFEAYGVLAIATTPAGGGATTLSNTTHGDLGAKGTYNFGDYSVWASVGYDRSDADGNKIDLAAGVAASISGFTAEAEVGFDPDNGAGANAGDTDFSWSVAAGYATGPYSISAGYAMGDGTAPLSRTWTVEAGYDLGGGVSLVAGYAYSNGVDQAGTTGFNNASVVYGGVSMAF